MLTFVEKGQNMNARCVIPLNKTISEYLAEIGETPQHSSEFIEINKGGMVLIGDMNNDDYSVFWKCMRIYEALGINYFAEYVNLRQSNYGNFSHGIEHWFNDNSFMGMRPDVATFKKLLINYGFLKLNFIMEFLYMNSKKHTKRQTYFTM